MIYVDGLRCLWYRSVAIVEGYALIRKFKPCLLVVGKRNCRCCSDMVLALFMPTRSFDTTAVMRFGVYAIFARVTCLSSLWLFLQWADSDTWVHFCTDLRWIAICPSGGRSSSLITVASHLNFIWECYDYIDLSLLYLWIWLDESFGCFSCAESLDISDFRHDFGMITSPPAALLEAGQACLEHISAPQHWLVLLC